MADLRHLFFAALENPLDMVLASDDAVPVAKSCDGRGATVRSLLIGCLRVCRFKTKVHSDASRW